jgi:hypothetical protein
MVPERDIVIFLGAGFAFDAGLPIMSDFGPKSREDYLTLVKHALKDEKYAAQMLVEAADVFYAFQNLCRRSPTLTSEDVENLETVFCIAEALREAGMETIFLQDKFYPLDQLIENIQMWLWKIYQQCLLLNPKRKTREKTYTDFFELLSKAYIWKRTNVISTNYDLIFEYLSWKNDTPCSYPFKNLSGGVKTINAGYGSTTYVKVHQDDHDVHSVLCKLHGSVNFFENVSNTGEDKLFIAIDLGDNKPIGKSYNFQNKPAIFAVDAIWKIRHDYGKSMTPAIVPPTYAKLRRKNWLASVWKYALNAISTANTILFIGYSMPATDGFMRALFHAAFTIKTRTNRTNIFVVDPNPQVHKNYSILFGASYRDIGHHTLESALKTKALDGVLETAI